MFVSSHPYIAMKLAEERAQRLHAEADAARLARLARSAHKTGVRMAAGTAARRSFRRLWFQNERRSAGPAPIIPAS